MLNNHTAQYPFSKDDLTQALAYNAESQVEYMGFAVPGTGKDRPGWQICRLTYASGAVTDIQFAGGVNDYRHVWDDRESYSYA